MATSLANRASSSNQTLNFLRYSFNLLRNFSTSSNSAPSSAQTPSATTTPSKKSKRRKKKNLFEVAQFLPNWGLGYHLAKSHWTSVSYEITKINLYKDGRHGKAWGIAYKDGLPVAAAKKISGVHKRCWKYLPGLKNLNQTLVDSPSLTTTEAAAQGEVQSA
ncbi:unnamed protein product [Linum tenue]|uniref:Mitochondrial ribosomal protein S34 n=1 Tax=Linum tenue TaxID=586396 RepID=A0AAV0PZ83_9ROSI|nr:unnamed protein product [Linum tenue]